jgi:amino acid adenylation domain-containing protein
MEALTLQQFLAQLRELNVQLVADSGRLRVSAPKGVLTPEVQAELKLRKEGILAFLQASQGQVAHLAPPLRPVQRNQDLPLSFAQQRLWFLNQLAPGDASYNLGGAIRLAGPLNTPALRQALTEIVRRHEALRTTFGIVSGAAVQRVMPPQPVSWQYRDLRMLPAEEREAEAQRLLAAAMQQPFDLVCGPLFRTTLLQLAPETHLLVMTMHHIVADGWSLSVLTHEVQTLYDDFVTRGQPSLPPLPIQYADFAHWQRRCLHEAVLDPQLRYWKQQLAGSPALDLPADRARPAGGSQAGGFLLAHLAPGLVQNLKTLARRENATLFMVLLAAFQTLLYRYSGQEDLSVGTPVANRNQVEVERLVGVFINTLVLRTNLAGDPTFSELLARVRTVVIDAFAHQDTPFELLVEALQPDRASSLSPLFQVMFILQSASPTKVELTGLTATPVRINPVAAKFALTLEALEKPEGLELSWEYRTDLFDASTIEAMMGHYRVLLEAIVQDSGQHISALPLLTEAERSRMITDWNITDSIYTGLERATEHCVYELFDAQVARTPDAVAVVFGDRSLTYAELNRQANQLAHYLQAAGVGPETLTGVYLERSPEMVIALLGILKAGGAYVPLDPIYPPDRLAYMLEDAHVCTLLTQTSLLDSLPTHSGPTICLEDVWENIARLDDCPVMSDVRPDNLAYVIYTSGSTGRPKGVQVLQGSVAQFLASMARRPGIEAADTLLAVTTLSFDIAGLELYLPLTVGARLVICPTDVAADGSALRALLEASGATFMQATPTTWRILIEAGWQGRPGLKILCGGEAIPRDLADALLRRCGSLWNMYGPTETTIWSTLCRVEPGDDTPSIGRPIANTQLYVLDAHQQPVPQNVSGELYIGGAGVARGYLHRPELTAEKFLPDPFSGQPGARMYRTGDLVRWLPGGNLAYLGRLDHQVKIRGYRIELGEIEAALGRHATVAQAVVVAHTDPGGMARLVAYLITSQAPTPSTSELREFLQQTLPDYMVPSIFIYLDAFPLAPNGKINRRALPVPDMARPQLAISYVPPQTDAEQRIAAVWQEALKLDHVGIHDNFFDLGGHSLLTVQIHSRLCELFDTDLSIADMFRYPTISSLAEHLIHPSAERSPRDGLRERAERQREVLLQQSQSRAR